MNKIKSLLNNKIFKISLKILKVITYVLVICFILVVYLQRFSDNRLSLFSFRIYTVVTGSMVPKYEVGDVLISQNTKPKDIKVGDTITYSGLKGSFKNKLVTHDVVDIEKNDDGKYTFYTKGLANLVVDPVVSEDQVHGKVVYKTFLLSAIYKIVNTKVGFLLCILIPILLMVGYEIFKIALKRERERLES